MLGLKPVVARLGALAAAVLLVALSAGPAYASIVQALDLDELVEDSEQILLGEVVLSESFVRPNGMIGTWHRIRVERRLRGSGSEAGEVIVETLGGTIGEVGMRVAGEPSFSLGERVVVFLRSEAPYAAARPVGMGQGVMRVRTQGGLDMVRQSREGMLLVRRNAQGRLERGVGALREPQRLERFLDAVRDIVQQKSGVPR